MEELCQYVAPARFFNVSEILPLADLEVDQESFLSSYRHYIEGLKAGTLATFRHFSSAISIDPEAFHTCMIGSEKYMAKPLKPLIQMQQHRFFPSKTAGAFHSMVMSQESIHWGIQFSYPQLYQDEHLMVKAVKETEEFPNTALFKKLQRWVRTRTVPTPFIVEGRQVNVPIRLGKNCFSWING